MKKLLSLILALIITVTTLNGITVSAEEDLQNIALGCDYYFTHSPQPNYGDSGGELTDGVVGSSNFFDKSWVAWGGVSDGSMVNVTIDLGAVKEFEEIEIVSLNAESSGINYPEGRVYVYFSNDDENYEFFANNPFPIEPKNSVYTNTLEAFDSKKARYVKISFKARTWAFISEIRVMGYDKEVKPDPIEPEVPDIEKPTVSILNGESLTAFAGEVLTFEAEASVAEGNLSYQWYKDGEAIDGASGKIYTITDVSAEDGGVYKIIAYNTVLNETTSAFAEIEVVVDGGATNVALGKSYEWQSSYMSAYPDKTGKEMTDGVIPSTLSYREEGYTGFEQSSSASVIIDLGENGAKFTKVNAVFMANGGGDGIRIPGKVTVYYSLNGEDYILYDVWYHNDFDFKGIYGVSVEGEEVSARYLKIKTDATENRGYDFISEIMVYGEELESYIIESGVSSKVNWSFDNKGVLVIEGEGEMGRYDHYKDGDYAPWYHLDVRKVIIKDGVTNIGMEAFYNLPLEEIEIADSVNEIEDRAFESSELTKIVIPKGVKTIGTGVFDGCAKLDSVTVAEDNTVYYSGGNCIIEREEERLVYGFDNSVIPDGVKIIGRISFRSCEKLESVEMPDSVEIIESEAFRGCYALKSVKLSDNLKEIGDNAFYWCFSLEALNLPEGLRDIADNAFSHCGITSIAIPSSVSYIGQGVFRCCTDLETVTVADGNETYYSAGNCIIETETDTLVAGCQKSVIPDTVKAIGNYAFCLLTDHNFTSINIPVSVTKIGHCAFDECVNLRNIYYGGNREEWSRVEIPDDNDFLSTAKIHYAEGPVIISGTVTSYGDPEDEVTIELFDGDEVIDKKVLTGKEVAYTFENVTSGADRIRFSKPKHTPCEHYIYIRDYDFTGLEDEILLYGDVNADGLINNQDVLQINRKNANLKSVFTAMDYIREYKEKVADVTGDGAVNNADVLQINRKNANMKSVFDNL